MKITEYRTVQSGTFDTLDKQVSGLIAEGFQPLGSPYAFVSKDGTAFLCQAMVKYQPAEK